MEREERGRLREGVVMMARAGEPFSWVLLLLLSLLLLLALGGWFSSVLFFGSFLGFFSWRGGVTHKVQEFTMEDSDFLRLTLWGARQFNRITIIHSFTIYNNIGTERSEDGFVVFVGFDREMTTEDTGETEANVAFLRTGGRREGGGGEERGRREREGEKGEGY